MQTLVKPTILDRLIGQISPGAGLKRYVQRQQLARAYEAASPRDLWRPRRGGADGEADHMADATVLRAKARALVQNVPYIRAGVDALVASTIGTGITANFTGSEAETRNKLWSKWITECDADGRLDLNGLVALAYRTMEIDGEVLVRMRARRPVDGLAVPLQLQLLEIDWLDSERERGAPDGHSIVNGIQYDAVGRRVGFWIFDQHPGASQFRRFMRRVTGTSSRFVPADQIIHLFRSERPGLGRGFTRLAPVIAAVRDLQLYEDAEISRKNLETRLSVLASGDVAGMANGTPFGNPVDPATAASTGQLGELPSGGITQLPAGMNIQVIQPHAAPGYVQYVKYRLHIILAAMGVPYEAATGDVSETTFSSARVRQVDFRRQCEQTQWLLLVPGLLQRIVTAFNGAAELASKVRSPEYTVEFATPKWDYVNPLQEVQADLTEISSGLGTISEKLRRRGYDPKKVFAEMKSDFEQLKEAGVLDVLMMLLKGKTMTEASGQEEPARREREAA